MNPSKRHSIRGRKVHFDLSQSPLHWLPDDVYSSHLINGINLLLPAGELWFCRVYNKAMPYIRDEQLREDVQGFIRQEALHAQAHRRAEAWLQQQHGMDTENYRKVIDWLFEHFLGEKPFAVPFLKAEMTEYRWLLFRLGVVASIEHFTGLLGDWAMNSKGWDKGDPVVTDLFRWHLAEEVEHRTVAYDVYHHLCETDKGFYLGRQAIMAMVFPLFLFFIAEAGRSLGRQDPDKKARRLARRSVVSLLLHMEWQGRRTDNVPTFSYLLKRTLRWVSPGFHPVTEGDTRQALDYIARSPAANAAG